MLRPQPVSVYQDDKNYRLPLVVLVINTNQTEFQNQNEVQYGNVCQTEYMRKLAPPRFIKYDGVDIDDELKDLSQEAGVISIAQIRPSGFFCTFGSPH